MTEELTHVDLFSGVGGICTGFKAAGIRTVLAVEIIKSCIDTYSKNNPNVYVIHKDIRDVTKKDLKIALDGKIDVLTSGMPCETFSTAGSSSRSFYDHRQQLYYEAVRIAEILKPTMILFENVPGILTKKTVKGGNRLVIDDIYDDLSSIGYKYFIPTILTASDFGIPQHRQRFFIIATNNNKLKLEVPVSKHNGKVSVGMAFEDLPIVYANEMYPNNEYTSKSNAYTNLMRDNAFWKHNEGECQKITYHIPPKHREGTIKRFKLIKPGENLRDVFLKHEAAEVKRLQDEKILPKKWFIQRNMRLDPYEPSKTVTSHCLDELIHPHLDRALTVREVARLQSFPDYYDFIGGPYICPHIYETQDKYEQIGDAVPPLLAYYWGNVIGNIVRKE